MLHLRIVSPPDLTDAVVERLRSDPAAVNLTLVAGAALEPRGDLVTCDVAREGANEVVALLQDVGVGQRGSIAVDHVDLSISAVAAEAERLAPGHGTDAAVWAEVDARVRDDSALSAGFLAFLVIASLIAAVGLVEDAPILIVGAMVVGPEFGPIAGLSVGLFNRRAATVRTAAGTLAIGLVAATLAALVATVAADAAHLVPAEFSPHDQPLTGFIVDPSFLAFVVALLAGVAGTLSLTQARAGALIGVLISVTTIPAAAAIGVSAALGTWDDVAGAAGQLALNVIALVIAGVTTLWVQREAWRRFTRPGLAAAVGGAGPSAGEGW